MAGFDAKAVTDRLDWDFTSVGQGAGKVPQPTTGEVRKFREAVFAAQEKVTGVAMETGDEDKDRELTKALMSLTGPQRDEIADETLEAVIEFCKGSPSRDVLTAVPAPVRYAFVDWLLGEFSPLF